MTHIHGGNIYQYKEAADFSANINFHGMPQSVKEAAHAAIDRSVHYPEPDSQSLKAVLAEREGVPESAIICGNGAAELVFSLCHALKPKKALIPVPTFAEYEQALESVGAEVEHVLLKENEEFRIQDSFIDWLHKDLDMIFLCNPNNPTGMLADREFLFKLLRVCREMGIFLVVDECFQDFIREPGQYSLKAQLPRYHNLFLLKAFTKRYAMAGVRLGYGITENEELLEKMTQATQPWNISIPAQAAGIAALKETEYVEKARTLIFEESEFLSKELYKLGMDVFPSQANYLFFKGPENLFEICVAQNVLIRDCSNYPGLGKGFYRVAVRTHEENERLIQAIHDGLMEARKKAQEEEGEE